MTRALFFALISMIFSCAACCGDEESPPTSVHPQSNVGLPAVQSAPFRFFSIEWGVEGAVSLDLRVVARATSEPWAVFSIVPDALSGVNHCVLPRLADGTYNNVNFISGSYTVETLLGSHISPVVGKYRWQVLRTEFDAEQLRQYYENTPFLSDATLSGTVRNPMCIIVAQINLGRAGRALFTNVYPIPIGWKDDVKPATTYIRKHAELKTSKPTAAAISEMHKLIGSHEPLLVVASARGLSECKAFTRSDMQTVLTNGSSESIASALAIARIYGWLSLTQNDQWLLRKIATLTSVDQLEGVTIAIVASNAIMFPERQYNPPPGSIAYSYAFGMYNETAIAAVRKRLKEIDPTGSTADPRWQVIDNYCREFPG